MKIDVSTLEVRQSSHGKSFVCCPKRQPVKGARLRFFAVIGPSVDHVRGSLDRLLNGKSEPAAAAQPEGSRV